MAALVRPVLTAISQTINLFTSPDFLSFMQTLRTVLAPFPEAMKALTAAMDTPQPETIVLPPPSESGASHG